MHTSGRGDQSQIVEADLLVGRAHQRLGGGQNEVSACCESSPTYVFLLSESLGTPDLARLAVIVLVQVFN